MKTMTLLEQLRTEYLTEQELAVFLRVDVRNLQDRRSRGGFIPFHRPSKSCILYHADDIRDFLKKSRILDKSG